MGTLIKLWKTIPIPEGATVSRNGAVSWLAKGKKRTGKASTTSPGKVNVQSDTWTAQFTDENGKSQRVSTKTTVRSVAEKILARYQTEVDRIRTGVATRDELSKIHFRHITLDAALERFSTKMIAGGSTSRHVSAAPKRIRRVCQETGITCLTDIRRETVERWIADEVQKKTLAPGTINQHLTAFKSFAQYLTDIDILPKNPLQSIRHLNQEVDRRKRRRAMTAVEVERLLHAAATRKNEKRKWKAGERELIYRLLLGTGLRSKELSLLTPSQIDFERCLLRIEAAKTKNKKADVLPLRQNLVQSVKQC